MVALFVWNRLRYDLVALLALLTATASGIVPPGRAFAGFGDQVVIIVASALVLSAAVGRSGMIGRAVRRLEPRLRTTGVADRDQAGQQHQDRQIDSLVGLPRREDARQHDQDGGATDMLARAPTSATRRPARSAWRRRCRPP